MGFFIIAIVYSIMYPILMPPTLALPAFRKPRRLIAESVQADWRAATKGVLGRSEDLVLVAEWIHFTLFGIILPTIKLKVYTFGGL